MQHIEPSFSPKTRYGIVVVTRSDIFPTNHGAAVKIERTAWGLSHFVNAVYLVTDDREHYHVFRKGVRESRRFPWFISVLGPSRTRVRGALKALGVPASDAFLYFSEADWSYILRTLWLGIRHHVMIYQAEFPAYARACLWAKRLLGGKTLLVEHNIEYERLRDQNPGLSGAAYGYLRDLELSLCGKVDAVITVSEPDRNRLVTDGVDPGRVHVVPHGVDLDAFDQLPAKDLRSEFGIGPEQPVLVYHGIYLYPPNLEAMEIMGREILPRLAEHGLHPIVLAIGAHPPEVSPHPDIRFTGSVEAVAPYLKGADIAVVPLLKGGGTRMKILDYFAARIPVVSTVKGIEGIPAERGTQAIITDDFQEFADAILRLWADAELRRHMGARGRELVETLDWRAISVRYLHVAGL